MDDKNRFQEMLSDILEVARVQNNTLTIEEVKSLFGNMELTQTQYDHIYAYLAANHINIQGYVETISDYKEDMKREEQLKKLALEKQEKDDQTKSKKVTANQADNNKDSIYLKMYLEDLSAVANGTIEEENNLIERIKLGDGTAKNRFVEIHLKEVIAIAETYRNKGLSLEDRIQEGNIGLLYALNQIDKLSTSNINDRTEFIKECIKEYIELAIKEQSENNSFEEEVIQQMQYLKDVAAMLAKEFGRDATIQELAQYTNLSVEDIKSIINMSPDSINISTSHHHGAH